MLPFGNYSILEIRRFKVKFEVSLLKRKNVVKNINEKKKLYNY